MKGGRGGKGQYGGGVKGDKIRVKALEIMRLEKQHPQVVRIAS